MKKGLIAAGGLLVLYFGLYFACVRKTTWEHKDAVIALPVYSPLDGTLVQAIFTPAHLIDAAYCRPALWQLRGPR